MALSAFDDRSKAPAAADLVRTLGRSSTHWEQLVAQLSSEYAPLDETWIFSGAKWGWSLRLKRKKRTVLYMTPCKKHFLVGFALGQKAVKAAHEGALPHSILAAIDEAPRYAEGRGLRIEVRNKTDRENVLALAAVKMAN
jgi:hypothetical protein